MAETPNPLVSDKPSDTNLQVALHPLVLITISDHITRHHVRREEGVVVGALLGQHSGRSITIEHAFPCNIMKSDQNVILHSAWFEERLKQHKDVHKEPALDLVGWFTITEESGPSTAHLPIHQQIMSYNESPVLLAFHPSTLGSISSNTTGKLPLTLYETIEDVDSSNKREKDSSAMQLDIEETPSSGIKFRALPYSIETEETEMIGVDYVAKGGGNAAALESSSPESSNKKGKGKQQNDKDTTEPTGDGFSSEDDDLIATLTTRLNSIRMLQSRIQVLHKYLESQPPSYLSTADTPLTPDSPSPESLSYLRQITALTTRLSLLTPTPIGTDTSSPTSQAEANLTAQSNDANLTTLLSLLGRNIQGASELGRKFAAMESVKGNQKHGNKGRAGGGRFDFLADQGMIEPDFDMG